MPFLPARAPVRVPGPGGGAVSRRGAYRPRHLLTDGDPHRPADEREVTDDERAALAFDVRPPPHTGFVQAGLRPRSLQLLCVAGEVERVTSDERGVLFVERTGEARDSLARCRTGHQSIIPF